MNLSYTRYILVSMEREAGWLRNDFVSDDEARHALAHDLGVPFVRLEKGDIDEQALMLLPEPLCRAHNLVAYRTGEALEVALLNLDDLEAIEPLRGHLPAQIKPRLTTRDSLRGALLHYQKILKERFGERLLRETNPHKQLEVLLRHAVHQHASEVHLDASDKGLVVRYRFGATLRDAMHLPATLGIVGAARTLAGIGSRTLPQEGRFKADLGSGLSVAVRVSSLPTYGGERLVLRLLPEDSTRKGYTLEGLGLHGDGAAAVREALHARRGLVLVCGTKASGRTTLLYTMLDLLNEPHLSLGSVEERPAGRVPYVAQASPSRESGLTTAAVLRALLRQDPDVAMVDAVGDRDTLTLALSAAKRGVLVLAAVDAPDVESGIGVLRAMGASDEDLKAVTCAVAVSLVRKLCDKQTRDTRPLERRHLEPLERHGDFARVLAALKEEEVVPRDRAWKELSWARVTGCSECEGGYRGQVGLFEVCPAAGESVLNVFEDGLFKAAAGITSVAEVLRLAQLWEEARG
jgi:type IV pilus assembly protein PilB